MRNSLSGQIINWKGWTLRTGKADPSNIVKSCPLEFWFDGQDTGTLLLNGNKVIQWNDKSGFDRHVSNAVDAQRPTYDPVTGRITFVAGNSTYLQHIAFIAPLAQPNTIYILYKITGNLINLYRIFTGAVAGFTELFYTQTSIFKLHAGAALANGATNANDNIHCGEFNGAVSNYWINGINVAAGNAGAFALDGITLGSIDTLLQDFFDGEIMEVFSYNCLLTVAERIALEAYLTSKWGL